MSSPKVIRLLIATTWGTAILGAVLDFTLASSLPDPLRDFVAAQMDQDPTLSEWAGLALAIAAFWFMIQGSARLYRLNIRGRRPFLLGVVLSVLAMPFLGPAVYNGWSALLYEASMVLAGVVVGCTYLSPRFLELESDAGRNSDSTGPPPIA